MAYILKTRYIEPIVELGYYTEPVESGGNNK